MKSAIGTILFSLWLPALVLGRVDIHTANTMERHRPLCVG